MDLDKKCFEIIKEFKLSVHPEGGWFREIIRSNNYVTRKDGKKRKNITGIYFLLCKGEKSCWHRVNSADEIWIYLQGSPLNLWCLDEENKNLTNLKLDSKNPIEMIPSGFWQAASTTGEFTLVTCCVGPGFDFLDFEMLKNIDPPFRPDKAMKELI